MLLLSVFVFVPGLCSSALQSCRAICESLCFKKKQDQKSTFILKVLICDDPRLSEAARCFVLLNL